VEFCGLGGNGWAARRKEKKVEGGLLGLEGGCEGLVCFVFFFLFNTQQPKTNPTK
jgi:hypothetical protein